MLATVCSLLEFIQSLASCKVLLNIFENTSLFAASMVIFVYDVNLQNTKLIIFILKTNRPKQY